MRIIRDTVDGVWVAGLPERAAIIVAGQEFVTKGSPCPGDFHNGRPMTGIVDWSTRHARMVMAMVALALAAGILAYTGLPKEGAPDIEIPALHISVPFPGISAEDSEQLLVRPLESRLKDLDGLDSINSTAAEGYAGIFLEFEFGWDKSKTIADVRDKYK